MRREGGLKDAILAARDCISAGLRGSVSFDVAFRFYRS